MHVSSLRTVVGALAGAGLVLVGIGCGGRSVSGGVDARATDGGGVDARATDGGGVDARGTDGGTFPCTGLSLAACRSRPECAFDICWACTCQPELEGCRWATEPPYECPAYGCMQPSCCEAQSECSAPSECVQPGTPYGCGVCDSDPGDCTADSECAAGSICEPVHCSCNGAFRCVPGCAQAGDCLAGMACSGGDHPRCVPASCDLQSPCPEDFDCEVGGVCARRACTSDLECDHFCVMGHCYAGYGECRMPAP